MAPATMPVPNGAAASSSRGGANGGTNGGANSPPPLPAIMDVEASGFGRDSYPIEIGYVLADGTGFCTLIRPAPHWTHWDPLAEQAHHIDRAMLLRHGRPVDVVARLLNDQLEGRTVYSDGWGHDYSWLAALFDVAQVLPRFRIDSLRGQLSEPELRDWHATKQRVSQEIGLQRHRASADAWLLQQTVARLRSVAA